MRTFAILCAVGSALILASCATAPGDSGITGLVTIGPTSPVQHAGDPGEAAYSARIVIRRSAGGTVADVKSGVDGRFSINLAPGEYVLEPQSAGAMPFAKPLEVTVEPHRFTDVTVPYDSGIR